MQVGLFSIGIGSAVHPEIIRAEAAHAERVGFATLWVGEHVVLFDRQDSKYPYAPSGEFPLRGNADWLDPFLALTFAAAATSRIRLATGICLVPEHNPVVLAKQAATLDRLSAGRFVLGAGIGWSAEEFAALGVPFERRADRTREYITAMRSLWGEGAATFHGEFVNFDAAHSSPKPVRGAKLPVMFGGESAPALKRVADYGDGWFGFNCDPNDAREKIAKLRALMRERGRDPKDIEYIVSPYTKKITGDDLKRYRDVGVQEVVILSDPPTDAARIPEWADGLARDWIAPARAAG
ncbi:MAG TPA: LLM class F420-dependent oxidoreductase [Candidatus Binataceae bacterium]|nr:LLM class F420-dependent oxidoreductase [Candidatus Binataceae bacterium]